MNTEDIVKATQATDRLIQDDNYYKYIFKKTERIVSVVFYIIQSLNDTPRVNRHIEDIEHAARVVHDAVLRSLQARAHVAEDSVRETVHALVVLESKLRVAQVSGLITNEVLQVLANETDTVLRGASKYLGEEPILLERGDATFTTKRAPAAVKPRAQQAASETRVATPSQADPAQSRQSRIKAVIETQEEVTIKDISSIINDVSEKTIQRDLNDMIENNVIRRVGERRWSKYLLF